MKIGHSQSWLVALFLFDAILIFAFGLGFILMILHFLQYKREYITIGDKSVTLHTGIISTHESEVPYNKINNVSVRRSLFGNMFSYGDVVIFTGNDVAGIVFKAIDNPNNVKSEISKRMGS